MRPGTMRDKFITVALKILERASRKLNHNIVKNGARVYAFTSESPGVLTLNTVPFYISRRFSVNADGIQYLTFRSQIWEKRETLTRNRGMRNYTLERYSSTLCPSGNIYLLSGINGYLENPHFTEMPLYGETSITQQGVEILSNFTTECKWMTNIVDPIIFDASSSPIDVIIKPIIIKIQDGYVLTFAKMNTNVTWAPDVLATKTEPGIYYIEMI